MSYRKFLFLILLCVVIINLNSTELLKRYFNLPFNGGLPKITSISDDVNIKRSYANYRVDLFDNYAKVHCIFKIENKGSKAKVTFAYPSLGCRYSEIKNNKHNSKSKSYSYEYNYYNFTMEINNQRINFTSKKDNLIETSIPYKYGVTNSSDAKGARLEKYPSSYLYYYIWNITNFTLDKKEKKTITVDYTVPLYYNEIKTDISNIDKYKDNIFDYKYNKILNNYTSEKFFIMLFNTAYSFSQKPFSKCKVKLYSHIIDNSFYSVTPKNYKHKGLVFTWFYKDFKPKTSHNIVVKVQNKKNVQRVLSSEMIAIPQREKGQFSWYHKFNLESEPSIVLARVDKKPFVIREIRMSSENFSTKERLKKANLPIKISISFSNKKDLSDAIRFIRKIKKKTFYKSINRRAYIRIFKSKKPLHYKYIKIVILDSTGKDKGNKIIKINNFEIIN